MSTLKDKNMKPISNIYGNSFYLFDPGEGEEWLVIVTDRNSTGHCVLNAASMLEGSAIHYEKPNDKGRMIDYIVNIPKPYSDSQWRVLCNNASEYVGRRIITLVKTEWSR